MILGLDPVLYPSWTHESTAIGSNLTNPVLRSDDGKWWRMFLCEDCERKYQFSTGTPHKFNMEPQTWVVLEIILLLDMAILGFHGICWRNKSSMEHMLHQGDLALIQGISGAVPGTQWCLFWWTWRAGKSLSYRCVCVCTICRDVKLRCLAGAWQLFP